MVKGTPRIVNLECMKMYEQGIWNVFLCNYYLETSSLFLGKIKKLKRREECDIYLTHVCRTSLEQREPGEKMKYEELSANTMAFINCRHRLTKVLADAARG